MHRIASVIFLLAACTSMTEEIPVASTPTADLSACKGEGLHDFIGQPVAAVANRLPEGARVIGPDTVVTQDYRPDRLNVATDAAGIVTGLSCG